MIKPALFAFTLACEILLGGSLILTLVHPGFRVWPPPGRDSWQYRSTWGLTILSVAGVLILGILDWDSFLLHHWIRFPLGGLLLASGLAFAFWGIRTLSLHASLGLGGRLTTGGPYRYSRNPQYVGDIVALAGYALLSNSWMAMISGLIGMVWFFVAPFTEEPWLRQKHGEAYDRYAAEVPRFLGIPRKGESA